MTKEEWDLKQNSLKKQYKYVPTGTPGQVKKMEVDDSVKEDEDDKKKKKKQEEESVPLTSDKPITSAQKSLAQKNVKSPSGIYSGLVDESGKTIDNPTKLQALRNKMKYLKHNFSDQADRPSNVYRPQWEHEAINYNKKKEDAKKNKA